jgi:hypothetical protein
MGIIWSLVQMKSMNVNSNMTKNLNVTGIVFGLRERQQRNAVDWMRVNSEPISNETDECDFQHEKHNEQRL